MSAIKNVKSIYEKLEAEWNKKSPKLDECGRLLEQLKIKLVQCQVDFLPTNNAGIDRMDIVIARNILEIGAQWSIAKRDVASFERYMAQLKPYYLDYKTEGLGDSAFKYQLLGLNLLRLLAQNKLADFHTELELLTPDEMLHNHYINHPIKIEQYLMEGSYNKVFLARDNVPATCYKFFMDYLLNTIRDEIASCIEKAYEKLSFPEAERMLYCESHEALRAYAEQRNWSLSQQDNSFHFKREKRTEELVPTIDLAEKVIDYATELEKIV